MLPYARRARDLGHLSAAAYAQVERVAERLVAGEFDDGRPVARIHGDLWSGNVLFTAAGVVLIDPAAHGGHGLTDLAMLHLFGAPQLETITSAYAEAADAARRLGRPDRAAPAAPTAGARGEPRTVVRGGGRPHRRALRLTRPPLPDVRPGTLC